MDMLSGIGRCAAGLIFAFPLLHAASMPPAQQTALIQKYCAVCHTDAARNGGLSLQHYDAAEANPQLAAMLLTKLRNGAMGAAGLGIPDKPTQEAWIAATTEQAEGAKNWSVIRHGSGVTASIVRDVAPRKSGEDAPLYRITMSCDGGIQLTWSPAPQKSRTFSVTPDSGGAIPYTIEGEEHMGNGTASTSGRASAKLNAPLDTKTLTVSDIFPGERVTFPIGDLDTATRRQFAGCLTASR
jgi:hypothetical protein